VSGLGRSGLSLAQAIEVLVESLTIRKLSEATTTAYQADLAGLGPASAGEQIGGWVPQRDPVKPNPRRPNGALD